MQLNQKQMPRLPREIRLIIEDYMAAFQVIMNLPKKRAIRRLVDESNQDIMERWLIHKMVRNGGYLSPDVLGRTIYSILSDVAECHMLLRAVVTSLKNYSKSSCLRWSFMNFELYRYPEYMVLYQDSLIFQTISYVTFRL